MESYHMMAILSMKRIGPPDVRVKTQTAQVYSATGHSGNDAHDSEDFADPKETHSSIHVANPY